MSSGEVRKVSRQDIQLVACDLIGVFLKEFHELRNVGLWHYCKLFVYKILLERCLQLYMNQKEVVETLLVQAKIEPGFTELVWQKLEEENREFFEAYHLRLMVKHQIMIFNDLLEKQVELMGKIFPTGVASTPICNGSRTLPLHQTSAGYATEHAVPPSRLESMHNTFGTNVPHTLIIGGQSLNTSMHTADDISAHTRRIDVPPNMLPNQNSDMGMVRGMNGIVIKSEADYSNSTAFRCADGDVLETRPTIGDASVASFSSIDSNRQPLNEPLLDTDTSAFGFLMQIPRNFSFSDLTADFSQSSDILEYSRSPFLDAENFLDSPGREECQGENRRLDTISESLSYEEFGSD
ncbi:hypothetical protein HHK36_032331 [Tetracentron sinense]|uniref:Uncharacterized protein n=1 Tax=Tetracentron sinense TaxID=13715 RepID=A0A835CZM2_TETSI|nr:hypothetical protein HHK36_032331 [Tetracentron sinense]